MTKLLLTSPAGYAQRLLKAFSECSDATQFHPVSCPMIETDVSIDSADSIRFFHQLDEYDYIAFSSRKSIEAFALGLQKEGIRIPASLRLCAIGKDNEMLRESLHTEPAFVSAEPSPMGIVRHLEQLSIDGMRIGVLAPQVIGMEEPPIVPDFINGLKAIGMQPSRINVYHTKSASKEVLSETARHITEKTYDGVVFTSGTEIKVFLQMVPSQLTIDEFVKDLTVICYGPYTARCAADYGLKVDFTSPAFGSFQQLVTEISHYYSNSSDSFVTKD